MNTGIDSKPWMDKNYFDEASESFLSTLSIRDINYSPDDCIKQAFFEGANWFRHKVENHSPKMINGIEMYYPETPE